jgi:hypothetical protein
MKHLLIACPVAAILLAAAGCIKSEVPSGPASYLAVSNSKVTFIQWRTAHDGHLQGTITEHGVGGSAPAQKVSSSSERLTGTMTGKSVRLTFARLYFLHAGAHGTVNGDVLTMWVPQSDGTIRKSNFSQSGTSGYDRAVARLHSKVRHANLLAAKQQARQHEGPVNAQARRNTQKALSTLYATSSLASGGALAHRIARFAEHVHAARAHLAAERKEASLSKKYCRAAFRVTGDAKAVDGALLSVQGDVVALKADVTNIRQDVRTTNALLRHLKKAGVSMPSSAAGVIASASANLKQAIAKANFYIDQINATDAKARSISNKMAMGRCSGAQNGAVLHPIPHIK